MLKLHLGCGDVHVPGYVNIDIQDGSAVDMVADIRDLPFKDCTADVIYACCVLEHFSRHEWLGVIKYWYRLLIRNGILRLSVPDFGACCTEYLKRGDIEALLGLIVGGQKDEYDRHGMIFDLKYLTKKLQGLGFVDVVKYNWRDVEPGSLGIDDYSQAYIPHMNKDHGQLMSLNVQARKP